ncbi:TetR family transcriptional regulator [Streptomyces sp. AK08-02]|uniref:TetR family transcriptional regulator n=1 Tax=Streptomyces sp. AK08-02 TaxID=3028654 RepID=UPI0029A0D9D5|nr:TetR family transcriptional regulator [Streptomyces sp. AK08-02]MDX3749194.1 TetR family transcriptional regulator [Streptomyces sp. AK08-02]
MSTEEEAVAAPPARRMRADAVRTRKALLKAAAEVFAEHGAEASIAQIAARAGIGKGTVFRHFPTKEDLFAAIISATVPQVMTVLANPGKGSLCSSLAGQIRGRPPVIQARTDAAGDIDWLAQIDSTIARARQHAAAAGRKGETHRLDEPHDRTLGRSSGGLTTKIPLAGDGRGQPLAILPPPDQRHDTVHARQHAIMGQHT